MTYSKNRAMAALAVATIACLAPARAILAAETDGLCAPLRAFASSVKTEQSRELVFNARWGSNFDDVSLPAVMAKDCLHKGDDFGKAVCKVLMLNGSAEFPEANLKRALACLSNDTQLGANIRRLRGSYTLNYRDGERHSQVTLELLDDAKRGGTALHIHAEGN